MEYAACEKLLGCFWIFIVPSGADISSESYFPNFFSVSLNIHNCSLRDIRLNYSNWKAGYKAVTLTRHFLVFLFQWYRIPRWHIVAFRDWSISFGEAIDMD